MLIRIFKLIASSGFLTALECTILYSVSTNKKAVLSQGIRAMPL